jgi:hypothetical protein
VRRDQDAGPAYPHDQGTSGFDALPSKRPLVNRVAWWKSLPPGRFVADSLLEEDGFEPSVPRVRETQSVQGFFGYVPRGSPTAKLVAPDGGVHTRYKSIRLTKAGLHLVNVVEQVELGLKPPMWCSSFPTAVLSLGFATAGIATNAVLLRANQCREALARSAGSATGTELRHQCRRLETLGVGGARSPP